MVLARYFNKADYATYRQTFQVYLFLIPLLSLGLSQALFYFLPTETERFRGRVMDTFAFLFGVACLFPLSLLLGAGEAVAHLFDNPALRETLWCYAFYPLLVLPVSILFNPVLITRQRAMTVGLFSIFRGVVTGVAVIFPTVYFRDVKTSIYVVAITAFLMNALAFFIVLRATPPGDWRPRLSSLRELLAFAIPLGAASAVATMAVQLDKMIISSLLTPVEAAVYFNGAIAIPLVGVFVGAIMSVITPELRQLVSADKKHEAAELFCAAGRKGAILLLPIMCFLLIAAENFIVVLFSERYAASTSIFQIYLLKLPLQIVTFGTAFVVFGKNKALLWCSLFSLCCNLILSVGLVLFLGGYGAAIATIVTHYILVPVIMFPIMTRCFGESMWRIYPTKFVLLVTLVSAAAAAATYFVGEYFQSFDWTSFFTRNVPWDTVREILLRPNVAIYNLLIQGVVFSIVWLPLAFLFIRSELIALLQIARQVWKKE